MLDVKNVSKDYFNPSGFNIHLFDDISLKVNKGEFVSVVAPNGSGKSTLAKIVSNLIPQTQGEITNTFKTVYIPSNPVNLPWLDLEGNIKDVNPTLSDTEILDIEKQCKLDGYANHIPSENSFGFRFLISLARALAVKPGLIVLDEPLTKFDIAFFNRVEKVLKNIVSSGISILLLTTNISETVILSDRIYLMKSNPGTIFSEIDDIQNKNETLIKIEKEFASIDDNSRLKFTV